MEKAFDDAEDLSSLLTFDLLKVSKGSEGWSFSGVASDEGEDEDGDAILRKQLDISYAQQRGYVNWNHSRNPADHLINSPSDILCILRTPILDVTLPATKDCSSAEKV